MLKGTRLQRAGWQHFYKAPIESKLNDFLASPSEIIRTLDIATHFWRNQVDPKVRKLAFGALHWHLFAQLYEHQFERFNAQYTALDACAELASVMQYSGYPPGSRPHHYKRACQLCLATGTPLPSWASCYKKDPKRSSCALADRRNDLVHEGLYGGQPIGFAVPTTDKHMERELTGLVARVFLALIGVQNEYIRSACTTNQTHGFSFS